MLLLHVLAGVEEQQEHWTRLLQQAGHLTVAASLLLTPAAVAEEGGTLLRCGINTLQHNLQAGLYQGVFTQLHADGMGYT